ncbi:hypothetical protein N7G274_009418 [Stereocaulon virgatum]|uniref:ubiquitinyl hydrolase 1 n=1 Tax=Stereocaulon virgatum TaxID=373712 RepID=A0ABR4A3N3_9LECA
MMASEQELSDMERMSSDYVPEITGPLVGEQSSTQALVAEYAQADPIYVHKTKALPSKYSHYRTLRGDGNCGWRALAFGYFEALLRIGDKAKVHTELTKLQNYIKRFESVGFPDFAYEDIVDVTFDLLRQTAASLPNSDGGAALLAAFNDVSTQNSLVYHFRLITAAWMKSHDAFYADFLPDTDVHTYCETNIEPFSVELEHIGLQALATALINEAGIAIEVLYLDRSVGEEVTPHEFSVLDAAGNVVKSASTIRLLYRPGHYDLLYKTEDIAQMAIPTLSNLEIRLVSNAPNFLASATSAYSHTADLDALYDIPGFTMSMPQSFGGLPYAPPSESIPSPPQNTVSTATSTKEGLSPSSQATSPPSTEPRIAEQTPQPMERKFVCTESQLAFDFYQEQIRTKAEPQPSNFAREDSPDMSKREDPAHYTNQAFQPQMWRPGRDCERSSISDASVKGSS